MLAPFVIDLLMGSGLLLIAGWASDVLRARLGPGLPPARPGSVGCDRRVFLTARKGPGG